MSSHHRLWSMVSGKWSINRAYILLIAYCLLSIVFTACQEAKQKQPQTQAAAKETYTCPMHPQIINDKAGSCPVCGMDLVKKSANGEKVTDITLNDLLRPSNQYVLSSIPTVHIQLRDEPIEIPAYGFITYDTRQVGTLSSNVSGRIEKLYVKYRYQKVSKGQKIMDIYSPELLTAQQNLLFLQQHDAENKTLIGAARQKLLLLGMSNQQLDQVIKSGKPVNTVSIYSAYSGHIHESSSPESMQQQAQSGMKDVSLITEELPLKEGMYVTKGQNLFVIYNPSKAWAVLNIFSGQASMVKVGDKVRIIPETVPDKDFRAAISFIEPFYRPDNKTATARVYFNNANNAIPIGSQVKAVIFAGARSARWLPEEAVLTLGLDKVVFVKKDDAFIAHKIEAGIVNDHLIQVLNGLTEEDEVAANAQYLVDSESFIKVKQ
ncbi:efflux RND transporter periplasmic adaptor subunit [Longitalea arenae]|uniref:efflux RND transporter periplasmic adaptor subunit n=1 Tax=Longitalea arenae TaxID=2812558 RepID=UPI001966E927|nr:efflux RND transporter periplasmic adaptor subunit [Longitalea arenae]